MPFLAVSRRSSPFQHQKAQDIYSSVSSGAFSYYRVLLLEAGERGMDVRGLYSTRVSWRGRAGIKGKAEGGRGFVHNVHDRL